MGLEKEFLSFDVPTAKAYFNFVVQLANGESTIKPIIKREIDMVVKLSANETHLEGKGTTAMQCNINDPHLK